MQLPEPGVRDCCIKKLTGKGSQENMYVEILNTVVLSSRFCQIFQKGFFEKTSVLLKTSRKTEEIILCLIIVILLYKLNTEILRENFR